MPNEKTLPLALHQWPLRKLWLILILITLITRIPSLLHPNPVDDEQTYSVVANVMVQGGQMYADAIERKPPLLFWIYQGIFELFGPYNWLALHLVSLGWVLLSMWGLYLIGRQLFDPFTGWTMAALYSFFQHWFHYSNLSFNGELMMNLPIIWAILWAFQPAANRWRPAMWMAGALLCLAFLIKQPAAIAAIPLGLYFLLPAYRKQRRLAVMHGFVHAAWLTIGFFSALGIVIFILQQQNLLEQALFWTVGHHDVPHGIFDPVFWIRAGRISLAFVACCLPLVFGTIISLLARDQFWKQQIAEWWAIVFLFIASIIGVASSGRFYPHYYIQLMVPMALLAGPPIAAMLSAKLPYKSRWLTKEVLIGWSVFCLVIFFFVQSYGLYPRRAITESGQYLKEHARPEDRIFVWGQKPIIYLDARLRPANKFIATFPLTGHLFGSPHTWDPNYDTSYNIVEGAWEDLQQAFEQYLPDFIVDHDGARKLPRYPIHNYPYLRDLLNQQYQLVKTARDGLVYKKKAD